MKKIGKHLTGKQWRFLIVSGISFVIIVLLNLIGRNLEQKLYDQQMAKRWSEDGKSAQISCFFSDSIEVNDDYVRTLEQKIEKALTEASIVKTGTDKTGIENSSVENKDVTQKETVEKTSQSGESEASFDKTRLWADAYSTTGMITIVSDKAKIDVKAIGVEGDFFLFHPLELINGSFFTKDSIMQDGLVIDEDAAWQLFGSNEVAGMQVSIGGVPHYIAGVVKRGSGRLSKAAGLNDTVVYTSLEHLEKYGTIGSGFTYEIVMPSPTSTFALTTMTNALALKDYQVEIHQNTERFSFFPLLSVIRQFGTRSMRQTDIMYPYWENIARAYEDLFALMLLCKLVLAFLIVQYGLRSVISAWKHRKWRSIDIKNKWIDLLEKGSENLQKRRTLREQKGEKYEKKNQLFFIKRNAGIFGRMRKFGK